MNEISDLGGELLFLQYHFYHLHDICNRAFVVVVEITKKEGLICCFSVEDIVD